MRITKTTITLALAGVLLCAGAAAQDDSNDISAYYGFDEIEIIKLNWGIKDLTIIDFNGDGLNDIAVVNNRKAAIELLIQKKTIGPGEPSVSIDPNDVDINAIFETLPTRFERQMVAVSQNIFSFVCGDLNSDGMTDIAFYGEPKGLYVILQKTNDTEQDKPRTLSWQTRKKITIDGDILTSDSLICADLNNDKADDLLLAGRDAVYIVLQKEDRSLAEPVKYPTVARTLGIEVGDLNADKINDLILITNDSEKAIHVRFGLETGQLGPELRFFIEKPWALITHNIDQALGDEILTIDARSGRLACYKFAAENEQNLDWPALFYPLAAGRESTKRDLVTGDFDGDNLVDVVISEPGSAELIFYKQIPQLGLAEPVKFPAFADISSLSAADIDKDGKTELAVLSVKEKVIGISEFENNRLSFPQPLRIIGQPLAADLADIDGDGNIDCLYVAKDVNDIRSMSIIYNLNKTIKQQAQSAKKKWFAPKKKTPQTEPVLELKDLTSGPDGLKILDVDQDGLLDVLLFVKYEYPVLVRQTKKNVFQVVDSPGTHAGLIKEASLPSIAVADVDGKTGAELLLAQKNFARSLILDAGQSWKILDQYNAKSTTNNISAVAAFDIEGNGKTHQPAILLLDGRKGRLQILKADTDKTYRFEKELDLGRWNAADHLKLLFEPLTGTDAGSILLFDSEKFALVTPPDAGNIVQNFQQQFSYETKIKDGVYGNLTAGDINSDGRDEIIMVEFKRNHIEILTLDARHKPAPAMRFKIFEQKSYRDKKKTKSRVEPRELQLADVTGDDKADLVTIIHDRIIIYPQD